MKLDRIKKVAETTNPELVNKLLANDWVLLEVYKHDYYGDPFPCEQVYYVLGTENPDAKIEEPNTDTKVDKYVEVMKSNS